MSELRRYRVVIGLLAAWAVLMVASILPDLLDHSPPWCWAVLSSSVLIGSLAAGYLARCVRRDRLERRDEREGR